MTEGCNVRLKEKNKGEKTTEGGEIDETLLIDALDIFKKKKKKLVGRQTEVRCPPDRHLLTSIYN